MLGLIAITGCVLGPTRHSLTTMNVSPPGLMVAKRSPRTLYLVVDSAKLPAEITVQMAGNPTRETIADLQEFVRRDLKKAFSAYFDDVQVVSVGQPLGQSPHVVADVKIDRIEAIRTGQRNNGILVVYSAVTSMTWGLGLRPSESDEYLYSFAGESRGTSGDTADFVYRSMFESAITDMLKGYTDKQVHQTILALPSPAPAEKRGTTSL
jgi:hypothetical protein